MLDYGSLILDAFYHYGAKAANERESGTMFCVSLHLNQGFDIISNDVASKLVYLVNTVLLVSRWVTSSFR